VRATPSEVTDVNYIVTTLSEKSMLGLLGAKSGLNERGDRLRHLHPLEFLAVIFTDPTRAKNIKIVRGRGMVWKDFISSLRDSLDKEAALNNFQEDVIVDFAKRVNIDPAAIKPSIKNKNWDSLVDILISEKSK